MLCLLAPIVFWYAIETFLTLTLLSSSFISSCILIFFFVNHCWSHLQVLVYICLLTTIAYLICWFIKCCWKCSYRCTRRFPFWMVVCVLGHIHCSHKWKAFWGGRILYRGDISLRTFPLWKSCIIGCQGHVFCISFILIKLILCFFVWSVVYLRLVSGSLILLHILGNQVQQLILERVLRNFGVKDLPHSISFRYIFCIFMNRVWCSG